MIDFEQLKIENQTLNEKIEERNDELHKLKKKTTTTVQVLTHIKEKLQFVTAENAELIRSLAYADSKLNKLRDELTGTKRIRDKLRHQNDRLKQKQGFVGSDLLVEDFEGRKVLFKKIYKNKKKMIFSLFLHFICFHSFELFLLFFKYKKHHKYARLPVGFKFFRKKVIKT